jgi:hypothetical protein
VPPVPAGDRFDEPEREPARHDVRARPVAPHRADRPVNPALRPRPNWVWRVLALLVIVAVAVAVWVVLHSTILH